MKSKIMSTVNKDNSPQKEITTHFKFNNNRNFLLRKQVFLIQNKQITDVMFRFYTEKF